MTTTPTVVTWAKWGTILLGFLVLLFGTGVATITTAVKWAAAPIIADESRARQVGDSLIVSRLEAMDKKQDYLSEALLFDPGSKERKRIIRAMRNLQPQQVQLPENAKALEKK